jgi:hypothetical protein
MKLQKITAGFVIQTFNTESQLWESQEFVPGEDEQYETEFGDPIDEVDFENRKLTQEDLLFTMVQPN